MPIVVPTFRARRALDEGAATANYYEILGVEQGAGHEVIKRAFMDHALRFRREREASASADAIERADFRLHEIEEAWSVLRSPSSRAHYDEELRMQQAVRAERAAGRDVHWSGTVGVEDDLPVLEVLDVVEPGAYGGTAAVEGARRKRRMFGSTFVMILIVALFAIAATFGGRTIASGDELRAVSDVGVGSCVSMSNSAMQRGGVTARHSLQSVRCGTPDSARVVARVPGTQSCPVGTVAVVLGDADENLCVS